MAAQSSTTNVAVLHLRPQLGDVAGNLTLLEALTSEALAAGAKIVVGPECATTGFCITEQQVLRGGLGLSEPFAELGALKELAVAHQAYIVFGIAEVDGGDRKAYNSAMVLLPDGSHRVQRKRGRSGWHERGNTPFEVITTKYGHKLGVVICSDTYLMDACRILTLEGADVILCPANWWGANGQLALWSSRAHENGVHLVVANRFGIETDTRQAGSSWTYDMNDAPSAVLSPNGSVLLDYCRSKDPDTPITADQSNGVVLYSSLHSSPSARPWTVRSRETSSFGGLRSPCYRPDLDNRPAADLPSPGKVSVAVLTFTPPNEGHDNLQQVAKHLAKATEPVDVVVLPLFGVEQHVHSHREHWQRDEPTWLHFQQLVNERNVQLAVAGVLDVFDPEQPPRGSLIIAQRNQPLQLRPCIHAYPTTGSSLPQPPLYIDIEHARVGVLFNRDALVPELPMVLARAGCDILLITSHFAREDHSSTNEETCVDHWSQQNVADLWRSLANNSLHVAACDAGAFGAVATASDFQLADASHPLLQITLDSSTVRTKYLNAYLESDLDVLAPTEER